MQDGQQNEPGFVFRPDGQQDQPPVSVQTEQPPVPSPLPQAETGLPPAAEYESDAYRSSEPANPPARIEWSASEYASSPKGKGWFTALAGGSVLLAVAIYLLTSDIISTVVILILGILVGVFAARQPHVLQYAVDRSGIQVGPKFYPYNSFKSFSVADDQAIGYIQLMPLKRFMPPLTIHYDPADEDKIASTLAEYLPFEEHRHDVVDSITRRFRF